MKRTHSAGGAGQKSHQMALRDVANLAGVSEISVSRVMRRALNVSDALRKRVEEAADTLDDTPNRLAGALNASTSNLVAVTIPTMANAIFLGHELINRISSSDGM